MKREHEEDVDDFVGPTPQQEVRKGPTKKRVKFGKLHLDLLPCAGMYEKSYMHRKNVSFVAATPNTNYIITTSIDGHVKFWKKLPTGIEFVKHICSHSGPVTGLSVSFDGLYAATISSDCTLKIYDVLAFDMIAIIQLGFIPSACCWTSVSSTLPVIAVTENADIHFYDINCTTKKDGRVVPLETLTGIHKAPIVEMKYNHNKNTVISVDSAGMIEYWDATVKEEHQFPQDRVKFSFKTQTDLYDLMKSDTKIMSLTVSPTGKLFGIIGEDRFIRIFNFESGKILRKYDESLAASNLTQKDETSDHYLDPIDFGRRVAVENSLTKAYQTNRVANTINIAFDESENFIAYSTMLGIKLMNLVSNTLVSIIGKVENTERFIYIALYQGKTEGSVATGSHNLNAKPDPTIFATAFNKHRFYLFTRREPESSESSSTGRDVFNEKPEQEDIKATPLKALEERIGKSAIIHTTMGDIHVTLFGDKCPKTVENFSVHSKNNYYNGVIFHRVVKSFMIQTGDPLGDGTGGTSIWGKEFADEFHPTLKHDVPFTLSMANRGPHTNGSQFFISTVPLPYLDFKHPVFGRVTKGMDIVMAISHVPVNKAKDLNKPFEDIKIINIEISFT